MKGQWLKGLDSKWTSTLRTGSRLTVLKKHRDAIWLELCFYGFPEHVVGNCVLL